MDFSNYLFHASSMGHLMTDPKGKSNEEKYGDAFAERTIVKGKIADMVSAGKQHLKTYDALIEKYDKLVALCVELEKVKDEIELSETAKAYLVEIYCEEKYGRKRNIETSAMLKGTTQEEDGITALSIVDGKMYKKNTVQLSNEYVCGTPDIRRQILFEGNVIGIVDDIKCAWELQTHKKYMVAKIDQIYYWQLQTYMWLDDATIGRLGRVLINTPEFIIERELKKLRYSIPDSEHLEAEKQLRINHTFDDINIRERVIIQQCERDDEAIERMKPRVIAGRKFLQMLNDIDEAKILNTELK